MHEDLRPPGLQPPGPRAPSGNDDAGGESRLYRLIWILLGLVAVLALVVLVLLPGMVAERASSTQTPAQDAALIVDRAPPPPAAGVARHDAEQALQDFLRLRAQPGLENAGVWADEQWRQALAAAAAGDAHYGRGRFDAARESYEAAGRQLQALLDGRDARLSGLMRQGREALQRDDSAAAMSAFEQVLAMQPDHEQAAAGLERARVRDDVLARMAEGRQAEAANELRRAADAYLAAVGLDPRHTGARAALERVNAELDRQTFARTMGQALEALDRGDLSAAKEAIAAAAGLFPDDPAISDARQRLARRQRQARLDALRRQAGHEIAVENWAAAASTYRKALALDPTATYASTGLQRARQRIRLHEQLDHYLADPFRLQDDQPLANARKLLAANRHVPPDEPALGRKLKALADAVDAAATPVTLRIESDGQTEVAIYHVGRLGRFDSKSVTLRPGRYTVTGYCPGYRDVRKVIELRADEPGRTVLIRCEEPI